METGKEQRRRTGLKYSPSYRQLFILAGVAGAWLILWWLATRRRPGVLPGTARLLGFLIFLAALLQGLFLLNLYKELHEPRWPMVLAALIMPSLLAITGFALLFSARCHKVTLLYGILACTGMVAYLFFIPG